MAANTAIKPRRKLRKFVHEAVQATSELCKRPKYLPRMWREWCFPVGQHSFKNLLDSDSEIGQRRWTLFQVPQHVKGFVMPRHVPKNYENKYEEFIRLCEETKKNRVGHVLIAQPWVLGDTYDEVIESLSRLAESGLALHIASE